MQHSLSHIQSCISQDLDSLEQVIAETLASDSLLAQQITEHIGLHVGKRVRPALLMLVAFALGYSKDEGPHLDIACMLEFLHSATLLHDDILDDSGTRRGKTSAHLLWGNHASILAGDYLFAKAFQIMTDLESMSILKLLSQATHDIVLGELKHAEMHGRIPENVFNYMQVISLKTAKLFSVSAEIGAMLAKCSPTLTQHAAEFGHHLGVLFQIQDDIMDYLPTLKHIGKPVLQDYAQRKPTLPLIMAYNKSNDEQKTELQQRFASKNATFDDISSIFESVRAIEHAQKEAVITKDLALSSLKHFPQNAYTQALESFVHFAITRTH